MEQKELFELARDSRRLTRKERTALYHLARWYLKNDCPAPQTYDELMILQSVVSKLKPTRRKRT